MLAVVTTMDIAHEAMGCDPQIVNGEGLCITHSLSLEGDVDSYALFGGCPSAIALCEVMEQKGMSPGLYVEHVNADGSVEYRHP